MDVKQVANSYLMNTYGHFDLVITKGKGCYLEDEACKTYLDFASGIATNALGYAHPYLTSALKEQIDCVTHLSNYYYSQPQSKAAKMLVENTAFDKVFFCNSGTEANEAAIKLARKYGKQKNPSKIQVISMEHSFHGRTYGSLSATGQWKYQKAFTPIIEGFKHIKFNDMQALEESMGEEVCAVILEVIQGEGGVIMIEPEYLKQVRALCTQYDALMIIDEVQTGIGRCGHLFAYMAYDVCPDVVTSAKGLGSGIPVGAVLCKSEAAVFCPGDHGTTFGGNPLATTAITVVMEELIDHGLLDEVQAVGSYLEEKLQQLQRTCKLIKAIRGKKLLQGIELNEKAAPMIKDCMQQGLLLVGAGEYVVRLLPPLIISKQEIDKGISILEKVLRAYEK